MFTHCLPQVGYVFMRLKQLIKLHSAVADVAGVTSNKDRLIIGLQFRHTDGELEPNPADFQ